MASRMSGGGDAEDGIDAPLPAAGRGSGSLAGGDLLQLGAELVEHLARASTPLALRLLDPVVDDRARERFFTSAAKAGVGVARS